MKEILNKRKEAGKKGLAFVIAFVMMLSLVTADGLHITHAAVNGAIESFSAEFMKGGVKNPQNETQYIWKATTNSPGHKFKYKINYAFSNSDTIKKGNVKITVPEHILRDRNGAFADKIELAIPTVEKAEKDTEYAYTIEDGNVVITNMKDIRKAETGFIELTYMMTKTTDSYRDMGVSDKFQANISLKEGDKDAVTATSDEYYDVIDSSVEINRVEKNAPFKPIKQWNDLWGTKPADADDYWYLEWTIHGVIKENATQPYDYKITDIPASDKLQVVGYKMSGDNQYTDKNTVTCVNGTDRYDSVLTRYKPDDFKDQEVYRIKNKINATVIPADKVDSVTSATDSDEFEWYNTEVIKPVGHFTSYKSGMTTSYLLADLEAGKPINHLRYSVNSLGYQYPWTLQDGADPSKVEGYGQKKVTNTMTDNTFYLNETKDDKDAKQLTSDDYAIRSFEVDTNLKKANYNEDIKEFEGVSGIPADTAVVLYAEIGGKWAKVGTYYPATDKLTPEKDYATASGNKLTFTNPDSVHVTGIRSELESSLYYTYVELIPDVTLFPTDTVKAKIKDRTAVHLHNYSSSEFTVDGKSVYSATDHGIDNIYKPYVTSRISKTASSVTSDAAKRRCEVSWYVNMSETATSEDGKSSVEQSSGVFYDLLPKGTVFSKGSLSVYGPGKIDEGDYTYTLKNNYKDSGRTMLIVKINKKGHDYSFSYKTNMPWENVLDYGDNVKNPVAYETGNEQIADGYADDGHGMSDENKAYYTGLDPQSAGKKKFIYVEASIDMDALVAAVSGLDKKVMGDEGSYSHSAETSPEGSYQYKVRYESTDHTSTEDMIFFDSLENYSDSEKSSDWHGTLQSIDVSQLKDKGIAPVIHVSTKDKLDIESHHDLSDTSVWQKYTADTDLSKVKAVAVDARKDVNGKNFRLEVNKAITFVLYMTAPKTAKKSTRGFPYAYNNVYASTTVYGESGGNTKALVHFNNTEIKFVVRRDVKIHKASSKDADKPVPGATYTLSGTSDYGNDFNVSAETDGKGYMTFNSIEKGTYQLKETHCTNDWLVDTKTHTVKIDDSGNVTLDDGDLKLTDTPRIHGDLTFYKKDSISKTSLSGAKFMLSGNSKYGTKVMEYADSGKDGKVTFTNIEWGSYTLKEIKAPDNHILPQTAWKAVIDNSGNAEVSDTGFAKNGTQSLYNEPYHTIKISKESDYDNSEVVGAVFSLTGTSDYGTVVDASSTSSDDGLVTFKHLEPGTYLLKETKAPEDFLINDSSFVVKLHADGKYEVLNGSDEVSKNKAGVHTVTDHAVSDKEITVKKKWKDSKSNADRPAPVIHLTTDKGKFSKVAYWGPYKALYGISSNATAVKYADIKASEVPSDATRVDDKSTGKKIYAWKATDSDGNTVIRYWTDAQKIMLGKLENKQNAKIYYGASSLKSIDFAKIDTSEMTDMSEMFSGCSSLQSLDLSSFDASKVTNMSYMFSGCYGLTSLDVSKLNTSNVTNMSGMFWLRGDYSYHTSNLATLDLSGFNTSKVTDMSNMFHMSLGDSSLASLDLSSFDTSNVTNMSGMFYGCSKLTSLDLSNFDTSKVVNMNSMFKMNTGFFFKTSLASLDVSKFDTSNVANMGYMFAGCKALTSLDVSKFDTSKVTNMSSMFAGCNKLTSLDVSKFDTSKVTDMSNMFHMSLGDSSLASLDLSSFDTSNVTNMSGMFYGCSKLTSLDLSNFDTSKVVNMNSMFEDCKSLASLNLTSLDTSNVTSMDSMFRNCSASPDLSGFNTANVTSMMYMFHGCGLKSPDFSNFNTSKVTSMYNMFSECYGLTSLDLSSFDTSKVDSMSNMFQNCTNLTSLDLSSFDTSKVDNMQYMFSNCSSLKTIYVSDSWTVDKVTNSNSSENMFGYCSSLPNYTSSHTDKASAYQSTNPDCASNYKADGYLTYKAAPKKASLLSSLISKVSSAFGTLIHPVYAADYASTDKDQCTITKNGDEWIYTFKVVDGNAKYYVYEDDLDGYTSDTTIDTPKTATVSEPATITNTAADYKETGSLSVSKTVDGKQTDGSSATVPDTRADQKFSFTVTLDGITGTKVFGGAVFVDGVAKFQLANGESITFTDIPDGTKYTVKEDADSHFTSEKTGDTGTVASGKTAEAKFTNHYIKSSEPKTNGFTLKKEITGFYQTADDEYPFHVRFTGLDKNTSYSLNSTDTIKADADGNAMLSLKLKAGNSRTFSSLPVGTHYTVTEDGGDYTASYAIKEKSGKDTVVKTADTASSTHASLSTAEEKVDADEDITVTFTNRVERLRTLTVTKKTTGGKTDQYFRFKAHFTGIKSKSFGSDIGTIKPDEDGTADVSFQLKPNTSFQFWDVPVNTHYTVTELANSGRASYTITEGSAQTDAKENDKSGDFTTTEHTVNEAGNTEVIFTNVMSYDLPSMGGRTALVMTAIGILGAAAILLIRKHNSSEDEAKE